MPISKETWEHKTIKGLKIVVSLPSIRGRVGYTIQDGSKAFGSLTLNSLDIYYHKLSNPSIPVK